MLFVVRRLGGVNIRTRETKEGLELELVVSPDNQDNCPEGRVSHLGSV